MHHE
jgi:hypothetical protein